MRILSDTDSAVNLVGTDAILAIDQHPESREPLVQLDRGIFEDGAELHRKLATALFAFPPLLSFQVIILFAFASRTGHYAIRPAQSGDGINADLFVAEVLDSVLKCFRLVHGVSA